MSCKPFFLMALLVFGFIGNPFAFSNFDNKIQPSGVEFDFISSNGFVFAQTEEEETKEETEEAEEEFKEEQKEMEEGMKEQMKEFEEKMKEQQKEMEERMKEKQKEMEETMRERMKELEKMFGRIQMGEIPETLDEISEGPFEEEFTINAKTDGERAYVKIELKFSTDSTDQEQILEETIGKLTVTKEEADVILEIEEVSPEELEGFADSDKRLSGNLHIGNDFANIHLRLEFITDSTERDAILDDIVSMTEETATMMRESFRMRPFVPRMEEFEGDFNERMKKMEELAFQRAQEIIEKMQKRIDELEQRMQRLIEKLETGEYYGPAPESFESKSYSLSFEGSAEDVSNSSNVQESSGEIFLETIVEGNRIAKLKVTGGTVVVGETFYDFAFGKARSGSSGSNGSMVLIANLNDEEGNFYALKILLKSDAPLEEIELEPVNVEIKSPQSKIAGKYFLSGSGQLALIER